MTIIGNIALCGLIWVSGLAVVRTQTVREIDVRCQNGVCRLLFKSDLPYGITWDQSKSYCEASDMDLASIPDHRAQLDVEYILQQPANNVSSGHGVWVGGERSNDTDWRYMDGTSVPVEVNIRQQDHGQCVQLETENRHFSVDQCNEGRGQASALCQFPMKHQIGNCTVPGAKSFHLQETCYFASNRTIGDWYDAQNFCYNNALGLLAFTDIRNEDLTDWLHTTGVGMVWVGIARHRWNWIQCGQVSPMIYFRWRATSSEPVDRFGEERVFIRGEDYFWETAKADFKLQHYICQRPVNMTGRTSTDDDGHATITIVITVGAVILLLAVATVVVILLRKNRHTTTRNLNVSANPVTHGEPLECVGSYGHIYHSVDDGCLADGAIVPYGEIGGPDQPSTDRSQRERSHTKHHADKGPGVDSIAIAMYAEPYDQKHEQKSNIPQLGGIGAVRQEITIGPADELGYEAESPYMDIEEHSSDSDDIIVENPFYGDTS